MSILLDPVGEGGRLWRLPSNSRSLLYRFSTGSDAELLVGAMLERDDHSDIAPGDSFTGKLEFWAEEVAPFLRAGEPFAVWYDGDVGRGEIVGPCDEVE